MAKCIIHIGMHKTGSTSIQGSLKDLDDGDFYYARLGTNHSIPVITMFAQEPEGRRFPGKRGMSRRRLAEMSQHHRRKLDRSISAAGQRTLLISGEGIVSLSAQQLAEMRDYLQAASCAVEIVAYVRPPGSFMSSSLQGRLNMKSHAPAIAKLYPNYRQRFEKLDEVFGAGHVKLFKFAPRSFPNQDVVTDFCTRLGIAQDSVPSLRINETRSMARLRLTYQYHKVQEAMGLPPLKVHDRGAWEFLADLDPSRFRIAPDLVRPVLAANAEDIAWMEQRLGESLAEDLGEAQPGDYRSEVDLLEPLPGARERLIEKLRAMGGDIPGNGQADEVQLLGLWAGLHWQQRQPDAVTARRLLRQARRA